MYSKAGNLNMGQQCGNHLADPVTIIINGDGGCSFLANYRRVNGSSLSAWSEGQQPPGAVLHSPRVLGELKQ